MVAAIPSKNRMETRLPWAAFIACLVAFTALFLTSQAPLVLLLALALVLIQLAPGAGLPRFEEKTWPLWLARALVLGAAILTTPKRAVAGFDGILDPRLTSIAAEVFGAELLFRLWMTDQHPFTRHRWVVLFSGVVFIGACNTFEEGYIRYLAPLYLFAIVWTLIEFNEAGMAPAPPRVRRAAGCVRAAALAIAFGGGGGLCFALTTYRTELTRWSNQLLLSRGPSSVSGTSAAPQMRESYNTELSPVRVLRVVGLRGVTHLRGAAYDTYEDGRWAPALFNQKFRSVTDRELRADAAGERLRFVRFSEENQLLFLPAWAAGVPNAEAASMLWSPENGCAVQGQGAVFMPYTYEAVKAASEEHQGPLRRPLNEETRRRCLHLPGDLDARIRRLARAIGGKLRTPEARVAAVEQYLLANHRYSLNFRPRGGDPVADFLALKAAAHCQYFAAGTVLLLRCLGVPARYVNGYYAHESGGPGVTIVRRRDAHAWAEVWLDGYGWKTVDATPSDGRPDRLGGGVPAWLGAWERLQDGVMSATARFGSLGVMGWVWLIGGLTALYVFVRSWKDLFRSRKRTVTAKATYAAPAGDLGTVARRFEAVLRHHGVPCPPHQTWEEHLTRVSREPSPSLTLDLSRAGDFLTEYNAVRFGRPDDREAVARLSELVRELETRREEQPRAPVK